MCYEMLEDKERCVVVDEYSHKLVKSGYDLPCIRRIVIGGIKGYEKKLKLSMKGELEKKNKEGIIGQV